MSRRNKIIIFVIVALIILIIIFALIWWLLQRGAIQPPGVDTNRPAIEPKKLPVTSGLTNISPISGEKPELEATLKAVAMTFAERFGSYSNQGNFENLADLQDLMTIKMKGWTDNFILEQKAALTDNSIYYGITTQALSATLVDLDESLGRAEVIVNTQRQEAKGSTINPRVFYQEIRLSLVNTGAGWKIDEATWQ